MYKNKLLDYLFNLKKQLDLTIVLWLLVCFILLISALYNAPKTDERQLFSDQAVHISMALSLAYDFDLEYTLDDLYRFREYLPNESGPWGLFLKYGKNDKIFFAKPYIYAFFSVPFIWFFGLNGFIVINILCYFIIGLIFILIFKKIFNNIMTLIFVNMFIVFSPFTAWISVAHPDLFIAALLSLSGYFFLMEDRCKHFLYLSSFIFGLLLFEKITFIFVIPFIILTKLNSIYYKKILLFIIIIFIGWFIPTFFNYSQDGSLLPYLGERFYVNGLPYPFEDGWNPIRKFSNQGITSGIFNFKHLGEALIYNLKLLPVKLNEFLTGRQTGILLYFPFSVFLILLLFCNLKVNAFIVFIGLFFYSFIHWMVFPTNGYGGAGSYGSRYLMQVTPILFLSFYWVSRDYMYKTKLSKIILYFGVCFFSFLSILFQFTVLPPSQKLVHNPSRYLWSKLPAKIFPLEKSLLPTIQYISRRFATFDLTKNNVIYHIEGISENKYHISKNRSTNRFNFVIYQFGEKSYFPPMAILTTNSTVLRLYHKNKIIYEDILKLGINKIDINYNLFNSSFYDVHLKNKIRWEELTAVFIDKENEVKNSNSDIILLDFYSNFKGDKIGEFTNFDSVIHPKHFDTNNIIKWHGWGHIEDWGVWTIGEIALLSLSINPSDNPLLLKFDAHAYVPPEAPILNASISVNSVEKKNWIFDMNGGNSIDNILIYPEDYCGRDELYVSFRILNPRSPFELGRGNDSRRLGIGLRSLTIEELRISDANYNGASFSSFSEIVTTSNMFHNGISLNYGWSHLEDWGVWSEGEYCVLTITEIDTTYPVRIDFDVHAYIPPESPELESLIYVNDREVARWLFNNENKNIKRSIETITSDFKNSNNLKVSFKILNPKSPLELKRGGDARKLGIGLKSIKIEQIK